MIEGYFKQSEELFGDELYLDPKNSSHEKNENSEEDLKNFCNEICECQKCALGSTRNKFVLGLVIHKRI